MQNNNRFLDPQGQDLASMGLEPKDVTMGRYVEIDLSQAKTTPDEFAEFGRFDTFTLLNPQDLQNNLVWVYFNSSSSINRMPLHQLSHIEVVADRFFIQTTQDMPGVVLRLIIGGDMRAFNVEPTAKGFSNIGNFPQGFNVNNFPQGFNINNFPAGFDVTNLPTSYPIERPDVIGSHGNLWDNAVLAASQVSPSFDLENYPVISFFGHMDPAVDLEFEVSADDINWYKCQQISNALPGQNAAAISYHWWGSIGARYVRLKNIQATTITATAQAK